MKKVSGFTLLELIIVVGLTTTLAAVGIGSISRSKQREDLLSVVIKIVQTIQLAQERSIAGSDDIGWKVTLSETMIRVVDAADNNHEFYQLPQEARLLTGGVGEINFSRPGGLALECPESCFFEVSNEANNVTYQFRVLYSGAVEY